MVKDITRYKNRDIRRSVILDPKPTNYMMAPENSLPIFEYTAEYDTKNEKDPYVSKDLSILKYSVPEFINNNQNLMKVINDIQDATIEDGGSGAFYVLLKKKRSIK